MAEQDPISFRDGQIAAYQSFVVHVMKLNLPAEQVDKLVQYYSDSIPPLDDPSLAAGIVEGEKNILKLIEDNRDFYK